jgi:hypothetical protein
MFKFGKSSSTARVPRESIVTRSSKPDASESAVADARPAAVPATPGPPETALPAAQRRVEALAAFDAARAEVQRIQRIRLERELAADALRTEIARLEANATAAMHAVARALAARELGVPDAPDDKALAALRKAAAEARATADAAATRSMEAAEMEALAHALNPAVEAAQARLEEAKAHLRAAQATAAFVMRMDLATAYLDAAENAMRMFIELQALDTVIEVDLGGTSVGTQDWARICIPGVAGVKRETPDALQQSRDAYARFQQQFTE